MNSPASKAHRLLPVAMPVVLPAEPNLAVIDGHQPVVGDGDAMSIPPDIVENLCRPGERPLRIDHPFGVASRREVTPERRGFMEVALRGEEVQLPGGEGLLQVVQEQASEQPRQHPDREEESGPAGDPAFAVRGDPAAGHETMNVRVVHQVLSPGVQHAQKADLRAQVLRIGGDRAQRLRHRPEQDVVDHGLVLERDDGDLVRHREHHVEVRHVEQFRLTVLEPLRACETLAFRAVPVAARVVRDALMATIAAPLDVTAERGGAAAFDRTHGTTPRGGQRCAVPVTESRAEVAEHVRHFQPLAGHGTRAVRRARGPARVA